MPGAVLPNPPGRAEWLFAGTIDRALHHCGHVPALDGGHGVHDFDFDGSDIDTALPDDDDDVVSFEKFSQESVWPSFLR